MLTQGQSSYQTGGSLVGPANPPNYRGPGCQSSPSGGNFNSSWRSTSKPEKTPTKQVMIYGRISDPGGSGVLNKKEPIVAAQS